MFDFIGRKSEIQDLRTKNWRNKAQLIVIYGRRRVGKTALVKEAYKNELIWMFDGLEGVSQRDQLSHFISQLAFHSGDFDLKEKIENWEDAFLQLYQKLKGKSVVVFFDEFQWMAGMRPKLVSYFKSAWDLYFSQLKTSRFILCGSISSFMVKKVLKSKALYGRIDTEINLKPLSLQDVNEFFGKKRSPLEVLEIAMTFGCIPQYLLELNPKYSYVQNLNEYAFAKNGYFVNEYLRIFISHFGKNRIFQEILDLLAADKTLTAQEISKSIDISSGGTLTEVLKELEWAGFIERYSSLNKGKEGRYPKYRILDEYLHFYFKFIKPNLEVIDSGELNYSQLSGSQSFEQWQGYAFDRLCRRNSNKIADVLRFSGVKYKCGSWFTTGRSLLDKTTNKGGTKERKKEKKGTQIDLAFERGDHVLTVCECKWVQRLAGNKLIEDFNTKVERIKLDYPRYGIEKVLILGKKIPVPEAVEAYFDHILFSEDIFF